MRDKFFRPIRTALENQGWEVERTGQGHWRAAPPDTTKGLVHFSETDDTHGRQNILRDLRARGLVYPPPSKNEKAGADRLSRAPDLTPAPTEDEVVMADVEQKSNGVAVNDIAVPTPAARRDIQVLPPMPAEKTEDQLFNELKEARSYDALAAENLRECRRKHEEATRELAGADREKKKAAEDLLRKKQAFVEKFEAS